MILYKCKEWSIEKCKDYDGCNCKCTFSPIHIWGTHPVIMEYVNAKAPFMCSTEGCPAKQNECEMQFYKEVPDEPDDNQPDLFGD